MLRAGKGRKRGGEWEVGGGRVDGRKGGWEWWIATGGWRQGGESGREQRGGRDGEGSNRDGKRLAMERRTKVRRRWREGQ